MASYPNTELCKTLGNRCKSTSINSSQMYPLLNHSIYDSMCNEEWSELAHNLRELPGGVYIKKQNLLIITHLHSLASREAYPVHLISEYMPGRFMSRTCGTFVFAQSDNRMILIFHRVKIMWIFIW